MSATANAARGGCKVGSSWVKGGCRVKHPLVFLNVGANKGFMVASMLQRFTLNAGLTNADWLAEMGTFIVENFGVKPESVPSFLQDYCGACLACNERPQTVPNLTSSVEMDIHAFELSKINVNWLRWAFARFGVRASLVRAAATNTSGRVRVPAMESLEDFGDERASVRGERSKMNHHGKNEDCPMCRPFRCYDEGTCWQYLKGLPLDEYIAQEGLRRIHLVSIDTEGHDAYVIEGLKDTLAKGAIDVLEFEFNSQLGSWNAKSTTRRTLQATLTTLESFSYQCFWQDSRGCLSPASGACWRNGFERVGWSNLVCARSGNARRTAMRSRSSSRVAAAHNAVYTTLQGDPLADLWQIAAECSDSPRFQQR